MVTADITPSPRPHRGRPAEARSGTMSADFSRAMAAINDGVIAHADRDGLTGVRRAVFIDRGQHAPGERCPSADQPKPEACTKCDWSTTEGHSEFCSEIGGHP